MAAVPSLELDREDWSPPIVAKRRKRGRRSFVYDKTVKYRPAFASEIVDLRAAGLSEYKIAQAFQVSPRTLFYWRNTYPAFADGWRLGSDIANGRVEDALFQRATGYETRKEKVAFDKDGKVLRATYQEHVPADISAIKYWLGNRAGDRWQDRQAIEHSGPDGGPIELQARQAAISDLLAELRQAKRLEIPAPDKAPEGSDLL